MSNIFVKKIDFNTLFSFGFENINNRFGKCIYNILDMVCPNCISINNITSKNLVNLMYFYIISIRIVKYLLLILAV